MTDGKTLTTTLTIALMDAPFESARTATAFRIMHEALERGYDLNVFAYEGAVALSFELQAAHPNAVHGRDAEEEDHPLPKDWVRALMARAQRRGVKGKDVPVYAVAEDLTERGLETAELVAGVERVGRGELPRLFERFDQVWGW